MLNINLENKLLHEQSIELIKTLKIRFENNMNRHKDFEWDKVKEKLESSHEKLWSLNEMESTWWEPDVVAYDDKTGEYVFFDCSLESPKWRRSLCYDNEALESRKEFKPNDSAINMAKTMWIEILTEEQYRWLQKLWSFDTKTSSWVKTPEIIRNLWWAIFCDYRYDTVFVYHNWAESYYANRGFRWVLKV